MTLNGRASPYLRERYLVRAVARYLEAKGYRVRVDPDGRDYFDLVARRGNEVGLVEAKLVDGRSVLTQALRRRVWGEWVAVALGSARAAERLAARTAGTRSAPVGIWHVQEGTVHVVRPATPWTSPESHDPYAPLRDRFRTLLDALDRGEVPEAVRWDGVVREVRRASGGRGFREWRLDESPPDRG